MQTTRQTRLSLKRRPSARVLAEPGERRRPSSLAVRLTPKLVILDRGSTIASQRAFHQDA